LDSENYARVVTLHDLNKSEVRALARNADVILLVCPHTGSHRIVVGEALIAKIKASGEPQNVRLLQVSVEGIKSTEPDSGELELAIAGVLAIRGALDSADEERSVRSLAMVITDHWTHRQPVPWTDMLTRLMQVREHRRGMSKAG